MKKWMFLALFGFSQFSYSASCSYTVDSYSQWTMQYFRKPEPKLLPCSLKYYANGVIFQQHTHSRMPSAYFFAHAFDESSLESFYRELSNETPLNEKMFFLHVLWVNNSDQSKQLIEQAGKKWIEPEIKVMVSKMLSVSPQDILSREPQNATELDNLWAIFFATGSTKPVEQIASVLYLKDGHGIDIAVAGAASWSLISNTRQYPEVRKIVEDLANRASGKQKEMLQEVLVKALKNKHNKSNQG